jgi:hypothetical protein
MDKRKRTKDMEIPMDPFVNRLTEDRVPLNEKIRESSGKEKKEQMLEDVHSSTAAVVKLSAVVMGGIVSGWGKKKNESPAEEQGERDGNAEAAELDAPKGEEKSEGDEEKEKEPKATSNHNENDPESTLTHPSNTPLLDENSLLPVASPIRPEKPLDLIHALDLYAPPALINQQILSQLNNLQTLSEDIKNAFLAHPIQSLAFKRRVHSEKLIFEPEVHLKQRAHHWLRPFETHLKTLQRPIICLDLHFSQVTSLQVR